MGRCGVEWSGRGSRSWHRGTKVAGSVAAWPIGSRWDPRGPSAHGVNLEAVLVVRGPDHPGPMAGFAGPRGRDGPDNCRREGSPIDRPNLASTRGGPRRRGASGLDLDGRADFWGVTWRACDRHVCITIRGGATWGQITDIAVAWPIGSTWDPRGPGGTRPRPGVLSRGWRGVTASSAVCVDRHREFLVLRASRRQPFPSEETS